MLVGTSGRRGEHGGYGNGERCDELRSGVLGRGSRGMKSIDTSMASLSQKRAAKGARMKHFSLINK